MRAAIARMLIATATLCLAAPASAQKTEPAVGEGVGTYSCAECLRAAKADPSRDMLYYSWAQGWMTGWNLALMDAHQPTKDLWTADGSDQRAFLIAYCQAHPKALYMEAAYKLRASLPTVAPAAAKP
jgi:hypothetical protein